MIPVLLQTVPFSQFGSQFYNAAMRYGFYDVLLPFLLIFAVTYGIINHTKLLSEKKQIQVAISLCIALLFLYPHFAGLQPDPVALIAYAIPYITVIGIAMLMFLILTGILNWKFEGILMMLMVVGSLLAVMYIFMLGAGFTPFQWIAQYFPILLDPQIQDLIIILLVFGIIVWFVVSDDSEKTEWKKVREDWVGKSRD